MRFLLLEIGGFLFAHSVFLHATYSNYIPYTIKESPVSLWFSHETEIFGIHSHFLELRMLPPLVSSDSSGIRFPFRLKYFHMIPDASLRNFWRCIDVCPFSSGTSFFVRTACTVFAFINCHFGFIATFTFLFFMKRGFSSFPAWHIYVSVISSYPIFSRLLISCLKLRFFHFS